MKPWKVKPYIRVKYNEYYSIIEKKETLPFATTQKILEVLMLKWNKSDRKITTLCSHLYVESKKVKPSETKLLTLSSLAPNLFFLVFLFEFHFFLLSKQQFQSSSCSNQKLWNHSDFLSCSLPWFNHVLSPLSSWCLNWPVTVTSYLASLFESLPFSNCNFTPTFIKI